MTIFKDPQVTQKKGQKDLYLHFGCGSVSYGAPVLGLSYYRGFLKIGFNFFFFLN